MSKRIYVVANELCNGCRSCEMWCSWVQTQEFGPDRGLIKIAKDAEGAFDIPIINCSGDCPYPMEQGQPLCVEMCPTGAIIYADAEDAYTKKMELFEKRQDQPLFKIIAPWKWPYPWRKWQREEQ